MSAVDSSSKAEEGLTSPDMPGSIRKTRQEGSMQLT